MDKRYLFVCGCPRSGTTAMTELLNTHPAIAIGMERYKYRIKGGVKEINTDLFEEENFFDFDLKETNIFPLSSERWTNFYQQMQEKFATQTNLFLGDKSPFYFNVYEPLKRSLQNVKWVFMLRNIEAVAASYNSRAAKPNDDWPESNDYTKAVEDWNLALAKTWRFTRAHPEDVFVCEYERFFSGDEGYLSKLIQFLDINPDANLLSNYRSMTQDWSDRQLNKKMLDDVQKNYVFEHAKLKVGSKLISESRNLCYQL